MKLRALDIGGSGVKTALLTLSGSQIDIEIGSMNHFGNPDWENFPDWLRDNGLLDRNIIGFSCAGFIELTGTVKIFRVGNWKNKLLKKEINTYSPDSRIYILNDGEAHLMAHHDLYQNPQMCISLGTSLGFALADKNGSIIRPADNINFDIGEVMIPTRASNNRVWWALGSHGLEELQINLGKSEGVKHFGYRLGSFLASLSSVFRPKTIVLSGGITESWWDAFSQAMQIEFLRAKPDWLEQPEIIKSPFCRDGALLGIAKYIGVKSESPHI